MYVLAVATLEVGVFLAFKAGNKTSNLPAECAVFPDNRIFGRGDSNQLKLHRCWLYRSRHRGHVGSNGDDLCPGLERHLAPGTPLFAPNPRRCIGPCWGLSD